METIIEDYMYYDQPAYKPIRDLLIDPSVTEIMINGPSVLFVEHHGRMVRMPPRFSDEKQLDFLVDRMLEPTRRSISTANPYVDFRLPDGSRVNITAPPIALDGLVVTIRRFTKSLRDINDLIGMGTLSQNMAHVLSAGVRGRLNILFSGATGSGKTTTLGILSNFIDDSERIITIEDTAELQLQQQHVVRLECRHANVEGKGAIAQSDLMKNCLRMRPTRIIVGEVRGGEAVDMLQAILSGHNGCLAVLHASTPLDAISRLEMMSLSCGLSLPLWAIRKQIASAIDLIVQHEIRPGGIRKVTYVTEVGEVSENGVELTDIFRYRRTGVDENGVEAGEWFCNGRKPAFIDKFEKMGVTIPEEVLAEGVS